MVDIKARNYRNLVIEISFFGVLSGIVGTFLSVYALRLGATSQDIGLLSALPALVTMIWLIPSGRFLERYCDLLRPTLIFGLMQRLQYVLLALIVVLPVAARVPSLIVIVTLGAMAVATGSIAFNVVFGRVVPEADRPRVVSRRSLLAGLVSAGAAVIAGRVLEALPFPLNYSLLLLVGFAFSLISLFFVGKLVVPPLPAEVHETPAPSLRQALSGIRRNRPFVRFTLGMFVANFGIYLPIPLYSIYYVQSLNMGESWIGLINTVGSIVPIVFYPLWARAAERFGNRRVMLLGLLGLALFPLTTGLATRQEYLLIPAVAGAIFAPAWNMGMFNNLYQVLPPSQHATYMSVNTAAINLAAFTAPLLSTVLLVPLMGVAPALLVGGAARAVGAIVLHLLTREQGRASEVSELMGAGA